MANLMLYCGVSVEMMYGVYGSYGGDVDEIASALIKYFDFDDEKSLRIKSLYALDLGLKGAMYWAYNGDNAAGDLRRTVYQTLNGTLPTPGMKVREGSRQ